MSPVDHEAHGGHGNGLKGLDSAILQSQLVCLAFVFVTCCITMYRGTAWHNDGWHLPMVAALFFSTYLKLTSREFQEDFHKR